MLLGGTERTVIRGTDIKRKYCGKPNNIPDSYCYVHNLLHDKSMNISSEARVESVQYKNGYVPRLCRQVRQNSCLVGLEDKRSFIPSSCISSVLER